MAKQPRWKVKPKDIPVVKKTIKGQDWWVRKPGAAVGTVSGGRPAGGTTTTTRRGAAVNKLVPREWTGTEGLHPGSWGKQPRLNPDEWEWQQNPENQRWFARRRTELTGLPTQARADIKGYDAQTAAQQGRIQGAYDQFVAESRANAAAGQSALTALSGAAGAGYSAADPTAAVLGQAARQQAVGVAAPTVAAFGRAPDLARSAGVSALEQFGTSAARAAPRRSADYREQMSEAAEAQREAAATMRGQNLTLLGLLGGQQTQLALGQMQATTTRRGQDVTAQTAQQGNLLDYSVGVQKLANQAQIAREKNQTSRANSLDKLLAKRMAAEDKARGGKASNADLRQWTKRARAMWEGIPTGEKDPQNKPILAQYDRAEIIRELMAMGASRRRALQLFQSVAGGALSPATREAVSDLGSFW